MDCLEDVPEGEVEELSEGVWDDDFLDMARDYDCILDIETVCVPLTPEGPMWRTKEMTLFPLGFSQPLPVLLLQSHLPWRVDQSTKLAVAPLPGFPSWTYPNVANSLAPRDLPRSLEWDASIGLPIPYDCEAQLKSQANQICSLEDQLTALQVKYNNTMVSMDELVGPSDGIGVAHDEADP